MTPEASHAELRKRIIESGHEHSENSLLRIREGKTFESAETHLDAICDDLKTDGESATVLWNVRPWDKFHVLHAVYCQKLRQLISHGFHCTIILHDMYVRNSIRAEQNESRIDEKPIETRIKACIDRLENAGLDTNDTEILLESQLWNAVDSSNFLQNLVSLSHITEFTPNWSERDKVVPFIVNHLCELYYESIIDCDILLTGGPDVEGIWDNIREQEIEDIVEGFTPPLVLYYPVLSGRDGTPLTTKKAKNSISVRDSRSEIASKLDNASDDFLRLLFNSVLLWPDVEGGPDIGVTINGTEYSTYDNMIKYNTEEEIISAAVNSTRSYFEDVQR